MNHKIFFSFLLLAPTLLWSQFEIEASVGYDISKFDVTPGDNRDIAIRDRPEFDNSYGFAFNIYTKISPKTRLGFGLSGYARKKILLADSGPGIVTLDRVEFQDIRLNLGLKQIILENFYFKLNASIQSIYKPVIFRNVVNPTGGLIDEKRIFVGPEIRLGYAIKNIFIEIYGFKIIRAFDDPASERATFNLNGIDKDFSLGVNIGYTLNYPSKKSVDRKIQERLK